ncbi:MAG: calcium/sodium antiporter [Chlorobi bacterium]|nr:calcium/sodium antiporter [Chlorobiota bacterium]
MDNYLFLILGFVLLFVGGHFLVDSSVRIARRFNISQMVIGITVVAFGTSAPELFVSLKAVMAGSADISISNVIGSNIANIALVLGFVSVIYPLNINTSKAWRDWMVMMLVSVMLYFFSWNNYHLDRWEGIIFLLILAAYLSWMVYSVKSEPLAVKQQRKKESMEGAPKEWPFIVTVIVFVFSVAGLYFGSGFLVDSARNIARTFGISERVIGISVVAFGTSVPELATSLIAAIKKRTDISVGNIIGSNIFNILGILGVTASVKTLTVNPDFLSKDYLWMLGIALLLIIPIKRGRMSVLSGVIMVLLYVVYMYSLF